MSSGARRLALMLCGTLLAAGTALFATPPGPAAARTGPPDGVVTFPLAQNDAAMEQVAEYWTPARLKQASNYTPSSAAKSAAKSGGTTTSSFKASGTVTDAAATGTAMGKSGVVEAVPPATTPAGPRSGKVNLPVSVGKVFFRIGDKEYWCSASSVTSKNKNLVATAGHCAYDLRQGKPVQDWVFIPAYSYSSDGDVAPKGIYVGQTLYLHENFTAATDFDYDYAFVTVHPGFRWEPQKDSQGQVQKDAKGQVRFQRVSAGRLEDNVGAQGFKWNQDPKKARAVIAFGYPAGPNPDGSRPYDGRSMKYCYSSATKKTAAPKWQLDNGLIFKCARFTGGASGGPWLTGYDNTRRVGYLNGLNSITWDLDGNGKYDNISSPYFNTATYTVYLYATGQNTG